jgi:hypothetical protein
LESNGVGVIFDLLGEGVRQAREAAHGGKIRPLSCRQRTSEVANKPVFPTPRRLLFKLMKQIRQLESGRWRLNFILANQLNLGARFYPKDSLNHIRRVFRGDGALRRWRWRVGINGAGGEAYVEEALKKHHPKDGDDGGQNIDVCLFSVRDRNSLWHSHAPSSIGQSTKNLRLWRDRVDSTDGARAAVTAITASAPDRTCIEFRRARVASSR